MNPDARGTIACLLFVLLLTVFPGWGRATDGLDEKIDLSLEDARADEVFRTFGQILRAEVTMDPNIEERVTIEIHDVTVRTAMTAVCESVDCTWSLEPGEPQVLSVRSVTPGEPSAGSLLDKPIDISLRDAEVAELLRMVAKITQLHMQLGPAVEGRVTLELQDVPVRDFLDQVCAQVGCRWQVDAGDPPVLKVVASDPTD